MRKKLLTPIKNLRRVRSKQKSLKIYLSFESFLPFLMQNNRKWDLRHILNGKVSCGSKNELYLRHKKLLKGFFFFGN